MKRTAYLCFLLYLCAAGRAGFCADKEGTGAASFLQLPLDARSAAMGDSIAGSARGAMALFQNPAGLVHNSTAAVAFSHALLVESFSYDVVGAAVPLRGGGVLGAGAQYLKYGGFDSLDNTGAAAGSLSPRDSAFALGYGLSLDKYVMVGVAVKYINSRISGTASTSAMDAGVLINGGKMSLGFTVQNLGKGLKFNREYSMLPVNMKFGVYSHSRTNLQWAADLNVPKDGAAWAAAGAEYSVRIKDTWTILARAGYSTAVADTGGTNGVSAGFGIVRKNLAFDYAFKTMGMLGGTQHLGLTYRLGQ